MLFRIGGVLLVSHYHEYICQTPSRLRLERYSISRLEFILIIHLVINPYITQELTRIPECVLQSATPSPLLKYSVIGYSLAEASCPNWFPLDPGTEAQRYPPTGNRRV